MTTYAKHGALSSGILGYNFHTVGRACVASHAGWERHYGPVQAFLELQTCRWYQHSRQRIERLKRA